MIRVLSALVLLPIVVGTVWFLPPVATLVLASSRRCWRLSSTRRSRIALGAHVPRAIAGAAVVAACAALGSGWAASMSF